MTTYALTHLSDGTLLRDLAVLVARDRANTAQLLAHIAEVDARRLYAPAGFPSMYAYCVGELHLSEEAAFKRIHAARTARRFPDIFDALAAGRLHLSAVVLLAPHLTEENAADLLANATHRSKSAIEELLAQRFPRPELPVRLVPVASLPAQGLLTGQHAPGRVEAPPSSPRESLDERTSRPATPRPRVAPLAPQRFALQLTISQSTHDKLRRAQALLSHKIPSGDLAAVLEHVLDLAIERLETKKFGATTRPRRNNRAPASNLRHIPADVRRAVRGRDEGQCSFVGEGGRRCPAREHLEFDHIIPVARGGQATVENTRLLCRTHNQCAAEQYFGAEFMRRKRQDAQSERRAGHDPENSSERAEELNCGLRNLGFSAEEARRAAAFCAQLSEATLEDRFRAALSYLIPRTSRTVARPCAP